MRRRLLTIFLTILLLSRLIPTTCSAETAQDVAIVWVADVSGSMETVDKNRYWTDAVSLGIDLAPAYSQVALITVSDAIVSQTPLLDTENADDRNYMKQLLSSVSCKGNTDLAVGVSGALELLTDSTATDKHIVMLADISEGGFMLADGKYDAAEERLAGLIEEASLYNVTVSMLFVGKAPENSAYIPLWEKLAAQTGGGIAYISNPSDLTRKTEELYFSQFSYLKSVTTDFNAAEYSRSLTIGLPDIALRGAKIYATTPNVGLQTRGNSTGPELVQTRSYTMITLAPPYTDAVTLTLPPGGDSVTQIYLLLDFEPSLGVTVQNDAERYTVGDEQAEAYRQKTTIKAAATENGKPLFSGIVPDDLDWRLTMTGPDGKTVDAQLVQAKDGIFSFEMYPALYGAYTFDFELSFQGISLSASAGADVSEIELPVVVPELEPKPDYSLWIAIGIGVLIILLALIFAILWRRKSKADVQAVSEQDELDAMVNAAFTGKLDIYGVILDGGKTEIPATSFRLNQMAGKRWIKLASAMELSGVPYRYKAAEDIRLMPGANYTLIVKNHSDATVLCAGQAFRKGQQARLAYGQKMHVVFDEDENEYEIYYHNVADIRSPTTQIQLELAR